MGLLLKSLKQIDWQPADAPAEEELAQCADMAAAVELPPELEVEAELSQETEEPAEPQAVEPQAIEPEPAQPQAIAFPEPKEPEIQTAESTLERLNSLHELIDAALQEFSSTQPIVIESPAADSSVSEPAIASEQLEKPNRISDFFPLEASPATVVPPVTAKPVVDEPIIPAAVIPIAAPAITASAWVPAVKVRDEYRELRDHLLARFKLDEPSTLLAIDAGRVTNDASWLAPFAASLWETLSEEPSRHLSAPPRILLVEAAGPECGIARHLGLDCPKGLVDVLLGAADWAAAIQPTYHPQIDLLSRGSAALRTTQSGQIAGVWSELQRRYQAILVAAGPWEAPSQASWRKTGTSTAAILLPLADAAVVCVELDGTPQSVAVETRHALKRRGVRLLGCVVSGR